MLSSLSTWLLAVITTSVTKTIGLARGITRALDKKLHPRGLKALSAHHPPLPTFIEATGLPESKSLQKHKGVKAVLMDLLLNCYISALMISGIFPVRI